MENIKMRNNFIRTNIFSRSPQKVPKNKHRTFQNQLKWNKILDKEITKKMGYSNGCYENKIMNWSTGLNGKFCQRCRVSTQSNFDDCCPNIISVGMIQYFNKN